MDEKMKAQRAAVAALTDEQILDYISKSERLSRDKQYRAGLKAHAKKIQPGRGPLTERRIDTAQTILETWLYDEKRKRGI